jgi:hypothetical protein
MEFRRYADKIIAPYERTAMKLGLMLVVTVTALVGASCAHPLETVVDARHQARIEAANANKPLGSGAADGLGRYIARSRETDLKEQTAAAADR